MLYIPPTVMVKMTSVLTHEVDTSVRLSSVLKDLSRRPLLAAEISKFTQMYHSYIDSNERGRKPLHLIVTL